MLPLDGGGLNICIFTSPFGEDYLDLPREWYVFHKWVETINDSSNVLFLQTGSLVGLDSALEENLANAEAALDGHLFF